MSLTIAAVVTPEQFQQHLEVRFDVPADVTRLDIAFAYAPHLTDGFANLLTLTLYDPVGFRGEGHKMEPRQIVSISAAAATPGYAPGAIQAGIWRAIINTHMVLEPVDYRFEISFSTEAMSAEAPQWTRGQTAPRGRGWYRGDLHSHTLHSDADWDVPDLFAYARAQGLDFMTLTDHNTISPLAQWDSLANDDLLTMGGMELTTYHGHALALGARQPFDWRTGAGRSIHDVYNDVMAAGALFIIAHPHSIGNPACTGCDWTYSEMMPGKARIVEIWNYDWDDGVDKNERGVQQWYTWLNEGYRMVATAGSDTHGDPSRPATYGRDVVYADELSEEAILAAIRQGHLYLSRGARLELTAHADRQHAMMGDVLSAKSAELTAVWDNVPDDATLRWIVDGNVRHTQAEEGAGVATLWLDDARWCVVELRDAAGAMLAITNPIFLGAGWK